MRLIEYMYRLSEVMDESPIRHALKSNNKLPINYEQLKQELNNNINDMNLLLSKIYCPIKVVLMGEVKSGKSTLLNALVGKEVSPTNVVEATSSIIEVCYGNEEKGFIVKKDETIVSSLEEIFKILKENNNNQEFFTNIESIKLELSMEELKELHIVDTPGIATITEENYNRTKAYIQKADVVIWVINGNYLGQSDIDDELIKVAKIGKPVIGVVNRIDEVDGSAEEIIEYVEQELGLYLQKVFAISAQLAFDSIVNNRVCELKKSRYESLLNYINNNIEKNGERIKEDSILSSAKSVFIKDAFIHEEYREDILNLEYAIEQHTEKVRYYSSRILEKVERKINNFINNNFMKSEEEEITEIANRLSIIGNESEVYNICSRYFSETYISSVLNSFMIELNEVFLKEWRESFNVINKEMYDELNLRLGNEFRSSTRSVLNSIPSKYDLVVSGAKDGATMAGAWGAALAGYAAWLGPHAAFISIGAALSSIMPPVLIAGALTGVVSKVVKFNNRKEEYIRNIKLQINNIRKEIGGQFGGNLIDIIEDKNLAIESQMKSEFAKSLYNCMDYEEVNKLKNLLSQHSNKLKHYLTSCNEKFYTGEEKKDYSKENIESKSTTSVEHLAYNNAKEEYKNEDNTSLIQKNEQVLESKQWIEREFIIYAGNNEEYDKNLKDSFKVSSYICPLCDGPLYKNIININANIKFNKLFTCPKCHSFFAKEKGIRLNDGSVYFKACSPEEYDRVLGDIDELLNFVKE